VAEGGDAGFVGGDEGSEELDAGVGAVFHGVGHGEHEGFAAIGVDGVVAGVGGDDESMGVAGFCEACGDGEHDAIAEGEGGTEGSEK
jgi:hypothetical protein